MYSCMELGYHSKKADMAWHGIAGPNHTELYSTMPMLSPSLDIYYYYLDILAIGF